MHNLPNIEVWEALNELRALGTPYRITAPGGWKEVHRESISVVDEDGNRKEIGFLSYGVAANPGLNRFFSIVNIETTPISGWGSHQIMTVHQSDHEHEADAINHLEELWKTLRFEKSETNRKEFPTMTTMKK